MSLLGRDMRLLTADMGALVHLWALPILVLFVAGLFVPAGDLSQNVITVLTLFCLLMVTLPLAARLWHDDIASGVLEQIMLGSTNLATAVASRLAAVFILVYIPVVVITLGAQHLWLGQAVDGLRIAALLLLSASTLALTLLVAALTARLQSGALLVALLLIPFLLPVFIAFAATASVPAALYLLAAAAVLAVPLCCLATASVLRQQLCL